MSSIRRGQIYFVDFGPIVNLPSGKPSLEIAMKRPVIVISNDAVNRVSDTRPFYILVVPGTTGQSVAGKGRLTNVLLTPRETGLSKPGIFLAHQTRSIDSRRFDQFPSGRLSNIALSRIEAAILYAMGLDGLT